jgi:hypothetical protein
LSKLPCRDTPAFAGLQQFYRRGTVVRQAGSWRDERSARPSDVRCQAPNRRPSR